MTTKTDKGSVVGSGETRKGIEKRSSNNELQELKLRALEKAAYCHSENRRKKPSVKRESIGAKKQPGKVAL